MKRYGVDIRLNERLDRHHAQAADAIVIATGARAHMPDFLGRADAGAVHAGDVIADKASVGKTVVIAESTFDRVSMGVAEKLAQAGHAVTLRALGFGAGENLPIGTKGHGRGPLHALGVTIDPLLRLASVSDGTAYFEPATGGQVVTFEGVDPLVVSAGGEADTALEDSLSGFGGRVLTIGDCLGPRTVEQAILEGLRVGTDL